MASNNENFIRLASFYNQLATIMSAICVQKGGIAMENYVGRFFAADTLEFIVGYGQKLKNTGALNAQAIAVLDQFDAEYEKVKSLITPTQKPIYEMTLEEFEKIMNI